MSGSKMRKLVPLSLATEGGGPVYGAIFSGTPMNGTSGDDFMFGYAPTSGVENLMFGFAGNDFLIGDISNFRVVSESNQNNALLSAFDLDSATSAWTTDENSLVSEIFTIGSGNVTAAHVTAYVEGTAGQEEWFSFTISQGSKIIVDVDYGVSLIGVSTNLVIELFSGNGGALIQANDSSSFLDRGSSSTLDPYVDVAIQPAGTYIIHIFESGASPAFEGGENFLLHVSVAPGAHAVGAATPMGNDALSGGDGDDELFGVGGNDSLAGGDGDDRLYGDSGDDVLNGGAGADEMTGGTGNDIYYVDNANDVVVEFQSVSAPGGSDLVFASVSYTLPFDADVEQLETTDSAATTAIDLTGNYASQLIAGNAGVNILRGEGGNDTLYGLGGNDFLVGGAGNDIMIGGTGDDTYYVDSTSDAIGEQAGEGYDRIAASITLALAADADIERIDVENLNSVNAIDLTGSAIANVIYGNDGTNILRGEAGNDELRGFGGDDFLVGGPGTDLMVGGAGNDTFYVDDASDAIGEIAGEGNDRIAASVSFVLSNGADVETLEAVNVASTAAFDLTGSDSNNTITGNAGVNILRGEGGNDILNGAGGDDFLVGGAGNDVMNGGTGNDTYYVDSGSDVVNEFAGEGTNDRVAASVSYALSASADVERLEADTQSATSAMDLTGSSIANIILGNDGANILDGKGGSDTLTGFGGADGFQFTTALGPNNVDTIIGFVSGSDKIRLDDAIFTTLPPGTLAAGSFVVNSAAQEADDRILYNAVTGQLYYDADGNGAGAAVQFATLSGAPALVAGDFVVF